MQTLLNNQNITVVKHNTKTCRLINILQGRLHSLFQRKNLPMLSDIFRIIPRLCAGYSTMYRLTLLTSPEGNLQTPTLDPRFFYANKGCNSGDLTYKCSIYILPYFYILSTFENQNNLTARTLHMQYIPACKMNFSINSDKGLNCIHSSQKLE